MADAAAIRPYRVDIPQAALDDLAGRLRRTQWPDELPGATGSYGMTFARVRDLAGYWLDGFDWRAVEARLNSYPQFVTDIDGQTHPLPARPVLAAGRHAAAAHPRLARLGPGVPGPHRAADRRRSVPAGPRSTWSSPRCRGSGSPARPAARAGTVTAPRGPGRS